ncbi:calcium-binding protein, partial [uncultured Cardiobacterium sp.]|uniref:calcium-binding protein n=1 Tax=uncultured Cardiobacterium sp. TaxID=417619 RepID=UPI002602C562
MSNTLTSEMATKIIEKELEKGGIFHPDSIKTKEEKILALKEIIHRLDVGNSNGITVLYSGIIGTDTSGNVIQNEELIKNIKAKNGFRVLDNTPAFDFLDFDGGKMQPRNGALKNALISIFGDTGFDRGTPANDFLFGGWKDNVRSPGAFDIISNNFAAGAKGNVIAIIPNANPKQVFGATELKALLQNQNVAYINGLDKNELLKILGDHVDWNNIDASKYEKIFNKIKAASVIQMTASGLSKFPNDTRALSKYLEYAGMDMVAFINKYPKAAVEAIDNLGNEELKLVQKYLGMGTEFTSGKVGKFDKAKHIGKLGLLGLGLELAFVVREAKAADAAGDRERAKDIMAEWAVGEAGSEVAGTASTFLTTLAGTALLGLSAPVAAVAGVAVGIVAGIYGEDAAKELYRLTKDMDHNGRMDLFDRLGTLAFGQDFKPNEIPEMLKNKAVSLKPEMPLEELIAKAKTDIAYRYALRELNPFVAEGADYTPFNTDGTLDLWTPDNPNGMTEDYIRDRAYMVLLQMRYLKNGLKLARDLVDDLVQGDWDYMDHSRHPYDGNLDRPLTFSVDGKGISVDDHRVVFGSNLSDNKEYDKVNLEGGGRDDRIYGLNGHDRLAGKGGSDHLEGGKGHDIYQFSTKDDGIDTIFDSDGDGSLEIDEENIGEQTFSGIAAPESSKAGDVYYSDDKKYRMENMQNYWQFSVKDSTGNYKALAKLKPRTGDGKWSNGDLGITLKYNPDPNAGLDPSAFNPYDAGKPVYYYYNAALSPERVRIHGSDSHSSQFTATSFDDVIYTGNGELHHVMGAGGNDYIVGGNGREIIYAGTGNRGVVQNDDDTAFGGGNSDIITGGDGNDTLYADDGSNSYENPLPNESALTESEKRGDWISGQHGSDTIIGSAKKDVLAGGAGDDAIRAGAGDDLVLGDANYVPSSMFNNLSYSQQTFEKRWFADGTTRNFYDAAITVPSHIAFEWTWSHDDKDFSIKPGKGARMMATDRVQGTGNDTLHGGAGNDWMAGQAGDDEVHGDDGDDTMFGDDAAPMPEGFASGNDKLYAGKGKDKLHGGAGNDVLDASDDDNDKDELSGDEGDDQLNGGTGGDELHGGAGNDALHAGKDKTLMDGGSGNDIFFGNSGDDTMTDEEGDDHYHISAGTDSIKDAAGYDGYHIMFSRLMPPGVTTIHDSDGKGFITYQGRKITHDSVRAVAENEWVTDTGAKLTREGSNLVITNGPK